MMNHDTLTTTTGVSADVHEAASIQSLSTPLPHAGRRREWSETEWLLFDEQTRLEALAARDERSAWLIVAAAARKVLKRYSSSFFIVTRFLPCEKRHTVEVIYAAVRYPDEVVDTFPLTAEERLHRLQQWASAYERSLEYSSLRETLQAGLPVFAAAFAHVVRTYRIPPEHYRSFLDAMRRDARPEPFANLNDLIDSYIYGSAIVVGYFLAYVYGASRPTDFDRAMRSSRDLGIALQMTNFLRDVGEDRHRGRLYMPLDMLAAEGLGPRDVSENRDSAAVKRVLIRFARTAEEYYAAAEKNLDAFSPDCRSAIEACINVYRSLNRRVITSNCGIDHRESVPLLHKFRSLPPSKYWRLPLAYLS